MQETPFDSWVGEIGWWRNRLLTPAFLGFPGGSAGKGSSCNVGDLGLIPEMGICLEKEKATHSSILAWRIPWAEGPDIYSPWSCKELDMTEWLTFLASLVTGDSDSKESAYSVGDQGSIPRSGRSSGEGNGYPLQYSCLENPIDRGTWQATFHGVTKSD